MGPSPAQEESSMAALCRVTTSPDGAGNKGKKRNLALEDKVSSPEKKTRSMRPGSSYEGEIPEVASASNPLPASASQSQLEHDQKGLERSLEFLDVEEPITTIEDEWVTANQTGIKVESCPPSDEENMPFRLMDLPAEIRTEIYRACLTRPFPILLSKATLIAEEGQEDADGNEAASQPTYVTSTTDQDLMEQALHSSGNVASAQEPIISHSSARRRQVASSSTRRLQSSHFARTMSRLPRPALVGASTSDPGTLALSSALARARPQAQLSLGTSTAQSSRETPPYEPRPQDIDPLLVALLRTSKLVYKESRPVLYGDNTFVLDLNTALSTLAGLHQRSRGQIRHLSLTIPTHNEILERFTEVVRLSLRYCWRLQKFVINMPFILPGADGSGSSGNTTVYANAFDILRWLPKQCEVALEGNVCDEIRAVVQRNANLAKSLDELAYARRQLMSHDTDRGMPSEAA